MRFHPKSIWQFTAIIQLKATGQFGDMNIETDEDEHSIEMHLPYVRKIFQRWSQAYLQMNEHCWTDWTIASISRWSRFLLERSTRRKRRLSELSLHHIFREKTLSVLFPATFAIGDYSGLNDGQTLNTFIGEQDSRTPTIIPNPLLLVPPSVFRVHHLHIHRFLLFQSMHPSRLWITRP